MCLIITILAVTDVNHWLMSQTQFFISQLYAAVFRKKKEKGSADLSSEAKSKSVSKDSDGDNVASDDCQKDAKSEAELILVNR